MTNTTYQLIARNKVFCKGTLSECQKTLTGISQMIHAGLSTNFQLEEFLIIHDIQKIELV